MTSLLMANLAARDTDGGSCHGTPILRYHRLLRAVALCLRCSHPPLISGSLPYGIDECLSRQIRGCPFAITFWGYKMRFTPPLRRYFKIFTILSLPERILDVLHFIYLRSGRWKRMISFL